MPYTDLRFKPGINKEITSFSEGNGWVDCDKIRFRFGYPEKLNGWEKNSQNSVPGGGAGHDKDAGHTDGGNGRIRVWYES